MVLCDILEALYVRLDFAIERLRRLSHHDSSVVIGLPDKRNDHEYYILVKISSKDLRLIIVI